MAAPMKTDLTWHGHSHKPGFMTIWQDNEIESVVCGIAIDYDAAMEIIDHHNDAIRRLTPKPLLIHRLFSRKIRK